MSSNITSQIIETKGLNLFQVNLIGAGQNKNGHFIGKIKGMFLNALITLGILEGRNNVLAMILLKKEYIVAQPSDLILLLEILQVYNCMMPSFKHRYWSQFSNEPQMQKPLTDYVLCVHADILFIYCTSFCKTFLSH